MSADQKLGEGTFKVQGQISRDGNFLEAEVGELTLNDIKKIHAHISGRKLHEKEAKKSDDEKKADEKKTAGALELNGKVTFNKHSSAVGSLAFMSDRVTVQGAILNVKVPDTEIVIEKAGLEIFFGFKSKKIEEKLDEKSDDGNNPTGENKTEASGKD
ncbi:hypothetical protein FVEG_12408 [Fusarium verticillioides 7600]|uniref:Uncharacterized protein n=1 Tax=Gibberella moniliformis (strain M3125 / FGSC 7600) TaxID=334819 RepID=W7N1U0_GIBM7|nr:hypothetical protein FVEG_12408 [Fusarium verticillioides 7600]EWG54115.1 hypothetical protein FVEG_12408 [Fusarium verticillioides 7600]